MVKGYIEGYYGALLNWSERMKVLDKLSELDLNTYLYSPKEDPYHRREWSIPYPQEELKEFRNFVRHANTRNINFIFGISPGLDEEEIDFNLLKDKLLTFHDLGVSNFCILFDDLDHEASDGLAIKHANIINQSREILSDCKFYVVPQVYSDQLSQTPVLENQYLDRFFKNLEEDFTFFWTGDKVVSRKYDIDKLSLLQRRFGQEMIIWDNFYASDYCEPRVTIDTFSPFTKQLKINDHLGGIMINATGKIYLDLMTLELYSLGIENQAIDLQAFLNTYFPSELIDLMHYFRFDGKILDSEKDLANINHVLWNFSSQLKNEIYPYLHILRFMLSNNDLDNEQLKKRLRLNL